MRVILTEESVRWLRSQRVYFDFKGRDRLRPGNPLRFERGLAIEPYVGFFGGFNLCRMGFMSYSMSSVPTRLSVGRYCSIGHDVDVILDHHPMDHVSTSLITQANTGFLGQQFAADQAKELPQGGPHVKRGPPVIEHDVWVGAHTSILPGVTIATGAVVAANSVVTRDVGPYELVAGNPARLVRRRFPDEVAQMLCQSEWWRYRFTDFGDLPFSKPAEFAAAFLKRKADLEPYAPAAVVLADMPRQT